MPAFAALTINDGAATPVAHTFSPVNNDAKGVASFADRSGGIAIGFPRITFSLREPVAQLKAGSASRGDRVYKVVITIDVPKLESTSAATGTGIPPAPTVAYDTAARLEVFLPERGVLAERTDLLAYIGNTLSNASIKSAIQNLEAFY